MRCAICPTMLPTRNELVLLPSQCGFHSSMPASAVVPKKKLEAEPGAHRMRRKVTYTRPDGQVVVKEIIYTQEKDQDKVTCLLLLSTVPLMHSWLTCIPWTLR